METKDIRDLVSKNYKTVTINNAVIDGTWIVLRGSFNGKAPNIALRILNKFPEATTVLFTGGFVDSVYTRNTLRYCGYKVK